MYTCLQGVIKVSLLFSFIMDEEGLRCRYKARSSYGRIYTGSPRGRTDGDVLECADGFKPRQDLGG